MSSRTKIEERAWIRVALGVQRRYKRDGATYLASSIAYFGFLSLFPMLLIAISIIGFVVSEKPEVRLVLAQRLGNSVPGMGELIARNLAVAVNTKAASGIIGIVGLIWAGLGVVEACRFALERILRGENSGFLGAKLRSLGSLFVLGTLALIATIAGGGIASIRSGGAIEVAIKAGVFLFGVAVDFTLFAVAYRVLTRGKGPRWRELWPGALLGAIGWMALKFGGSWYAAYAVGRASEVYGAFAATFGILVLLFLASRLFLYGAELNAYLIDQTSAQDESISELPAQRVRLGLQTARPSR